MASSVLDKARLVTEAVATVRTQAMEMRLMFTVTTVRVLAVFIEPAEPTTGLTKTKKNKDKGFKVPCNHSTGTCSPH
jgi:hypothetical protein